MTCFCCQVKADRNSDLLKRLFEASKEVTSATGLVVGSAKSGRERVEETGKHVFYLLKYYLAVSILFDSIKVHVQKK